MKRRIPALARGIVAAAALAAGLVMVGGASSSPAEPGYDINTLAGKVASLNGTAGLQIRFSAFIEQQAEETASLGPCSPTPITPHHVLSSSLDGTSVAPNA